LNQLGKPIINLFKNQLFRDTAIYTITNALNSGLPFLMMPILVRYLSPTDYGIFVTFQLLCFLFSSLIGFSIHGAVGRQYLEKDHIDFPAYIGNCIIVLIASTCGVGIIVGVFHNSIVHLTRFPGRWLPLVIGTCVSQFLTLMLLTIFQMENKPVKYGASQILQTALNFGLSLILVVKFGIGWRGTVLGQFFATFITGFISLVFLSRANLIHFRFNKEYIQHALAFGVPMIPHSVGAALIAMTDRVIISNLMGVAETGVFSVGYQVGMGILLLQNSFNQAWVPWCFGKLKNNLNSDKLMIVKITYGYFLIIVALALTLGWVAPALIGPYLGKNFQKATAVVIWIALGYAFNGMYKMVSTYMFYQSKTYILAYLTFFTAILNIALCYQFVHWNGSVGAAQATALAFFVSFVLTWVTASRVYPMPWRLRMG